MEGLALMASTKKGSVPGLCHNFYFNSLLFILDNMFIPRCKYYVSGNQYCYSSSIPPPSPVNNAVNYHPSTVAESLHHGSFHPPSHQTHNSVFGHLAYIVVYFILHHLCRVYIIMAKIQIYLTNNTFIILTVILLFWQISTLKTKTNYFLLNLHFKFQFDTVQTFWDTF